MAAIIIGCLASALASLALFFLAKVWEVAKDARGKAEKSELAAHTCADDLARDMRKEMGDMVGKCNAAAAHTLEAANGESGRVSEEARKTRAKVYELGRRTDQVEQNCKAQAALCGREFAHGKDKMEALTRAIEANTKAQQGQATEFANLAGAVRQFMKMEAEG